MARTVVNHLPPPARKPAEPGAAAVLTKPRLLLAAATILVLIPFANKAFCMDDPLFLWAARQIQAHPLNFYAFDVNWYGHHQPMSEVTKNPPLASYYIALVAGLFGWREIPLHLAFLIPAIAAVLGTYELARLFCARPLIAALAALLTPVFLVSSTNLMCDTMMLAWWVWTLVFWRQALRENRLSAFVIAGLLAGLCALTKYFGMCIVPLMLADGFFKQRKPGTWLAAIVVPVAILAAYQWWTQAQYGRGLLLDAADFASADQGSRIGHLPATILTGLAFTGGCVFTVLAYSTLLWSKRSILAGIAAMALVVLLCRPVFSSLLQDVKPGSVWLAGFQLALFALAGAALLLLTARDLLRTRDADSLLLFLWVGGTFLFAAIVNWTVNGRSILPMAPAVGILLMRHVDLQFGKPAERLEFRVLWPLLPAALVALLVANADYRLANSGPTAAYALQEEARDSKGTLWFQGHWGFQYYMEQMGATPLEDGISRLDPGDLLAIPLNATNLTEMPDEFVHVRKIFEFRPNTFLSTMDADTGSGFYASVWGPLPWAVGPISPERYRLLTLITLLSPTSSPDAPAK
jgi:4-amino-4-deoxy-L-arabinose transferase-like glycosyltransferase